MKHIHLNSFQWELFFGNSEYRIHTLGKKKGKHLKSVLRKDFPTVRLCSFSYQNDIKSYSTPLLWQNEEAGITARIYICYTCLHSLLKALRPL